MRNRFMSWGDGNGSGEMVGFRGIGLRRLARGWNGRGAGAGHRRPARAHPAHHWSSTRRTAASTISTGCSRARTASPTRRRSRSTQRDHDGSVLPLPDRCGRARQARPALSGDLPNGPFRIDAPPDNCASDEMLLEPDPRLLPQHASRSTAAATTCSRPCPTSAAGPWATSTAAAEAVAVGEGIHARRQLLHGRVRRLVPESPMADLRLHAGFDGRAASACARRLDAHGKLATSPDSPRPPRDGAAAAHGRPQRRPGDAGRLRRQHDAAAVPAERHRRPRRTATRARRSRGHRHLGLPLPPQTAEDDRRHAVARKASRGPGTPAAGTPRSTDGTQPPDAKRKVIYNARRRRAELPAASPAVQLLRPLRARHAGPRAST